MLSAGMHHHYPHAFAHLASPTVVRHEQHLNPLNPLAAQHLAPAALDPLAQPQYALQFQQPRHHLPAAKGLLQKQPRHHPYGASPIAAAPRPGRDGLGHDRIVRGPSSAGPVRRRISRACDQCNQLRTKCDGKSPCAHCVEFGLTCEYVRERKKRGKASRKDIAQQQAAAAAGASSSDNNGPNSPDAGDYSIEDQKSTPQDHTNDSHHPTNDMPPQRSVSLSSTQTLEGSAMYGMASSMGLNTVNEMGEPTQHPHPGDNNLGGSLATPRMQSSMMDVGMGVPSEYSSMNEFHRNLIHHPSAPAHPMLQTAIPHPIITPRTYGEGGYQMMSPQAQPPPATAFRLAATDSPLSGFLGGSSVADSPGWLSVNSPAAALYHQPPPTSAGQPLRYPVLQPLIPHLGNIIPVPLACDLLELYFQSSSAAFMRPLSPYVLGYVFRKRSFLRPTNPRICSPALLASMLWIGAQTSESAYLTSPPSARGKICQKLLELTVGLLKPLIHAPVSNEESPIYASNFMSNGIALGGFGVSHPSRAHETEHGSPGATGGLDDVATYMHLAIVVSASEYKAASLRWWNAAWSLARELKLGRELPLGPASQGRDASNVNGGDDYDQDVHGDVDVDMGLPSHGHGAIGQPQHGSSMMVSEEEREERRRIWWLLYTMDRHLALCYNRPLFLLDIECDGLYQPVDDTIWQRGDYFTREVVQTVSDPSSPYFRRRGPTFECTGHSIFGFFLPLMTILGGIVDLNHARNHPRFGIRSRRGSGWDDQAAEITEHLEAYGRSLHEFEARYSSRTVDGGNDNSNTGGDNNNLDVGTPSVHSVVSSGSRHNESILQTKIVVAYATHVMHTLHILLNGKWDPISLLDDNDLWISSQSFITATGHAVSAAEAINEILEHDPDLSFMPFFFGIYLLQGSFLLLLIADKLQDEASLSVVKACETIVRAHEACVATLNTEYQRNFRKVMRSALAQVRGRCIENFAEEQLRRREVLGLYRWTGDGTGLAL